MSEPVCSKSKLEVLDALRGFCALVVVALHFSENYIGGWGLRLMPHGCLPVEYFFILTGFTLVYAYDDRWAQGMTFGSFFRRRVIRLQPLVVIGSVIGAACYLLSAEQYAGRMPPLDLGRLGLLTLWCCTMLPAPSLLGWNLLHPLQGPLGQPRVRPQWWGRSGGVCRGGFVTVDPSVRRLRVRLRVG